jgi:hypothetical protein
LAGGLCRRYLIENCTGTLKLIAACFQAPAWAASAVLSVPAAPRRQAFAAAAAAQSVPEPTIRIMRWLSRVLIATSWARSRRKYDAHPA